MSRSYSVCNEFSRTPLATFKNVEDAIDYARVQAGYNGCSYVVVKLIDTHLIKPPPRGEATVEEVSSEDAG